MKYNQLIAKIQTPLAQNEYYALLLTNAKTIVIQTTTHSKKQIAEDLGMSPQVFATAYKFIMAAYYESK